MNTSLSQLMPARLAAATNGIVRGRAAYFFAGAIDPAQARREAMATLSQAVGHEASVFGSVDLFVLLATMLIMALAIIAGRLPYQDTGSRAFVTLAARSSQHSD